LHCLDALRKGHVQDLALYLADVHHPVLRPTESVYGLQDELGQINGIVHLPFTTGIAWRLSIST